MNQAILFFSHNGIIGLIIAVIAIFAVIALVRAAIKAAVVIAIIGVILVTVFGFSTSDLINKGKAAVNGATSFYQKNIEPGLNKEIDQAKFKVNPDGSYVIKTSEVTITGQKNSSMVTIKYKGTSYKIDSSKLSQHIQQVIKNNINKVNISNDSNSNSAMTG